jgi:Asp-tRNA(Asn)/Glu-tRNA(Gln) amidotransferase A subunit family amidase
VGIDSTGDPVMNLPWTHAGLPAVGVPAGRVDGLPVGLQCVARFGADERLLAWAEDVADAVAGVGAGAG